MQKLITQLNSAKKERNVVDSRQSVQRSQHSHYCKNVLPFLCSTWTKKPCKKFLINMRTGNGLLFALTDASTQVRIVNQLFEINLSRKNGRIDINVSVFDKKTFSSKPKCQFSILGGKYFHFQGARKFKRIYADSDEPNFVLGVKTCRKMDGAIA